jgi:hypothetical protein
VAKPKVTVRVIAEGPLEPEPKWNLTRFFEAVQVFGVQYLLYVLLCINFRGIAQANYPVALISDTLIAAMQFFVMRRIAKAEEPNHLFAGYVIGSVLGSAAGIQLSKTYL